MTKLQDQRIGRKLSQEELSKLAGISKRTLQDYEQKRRNIDGAQIETLAKIANALNSGITDIIENDELVDLLKETRM